MARIRASVVALGALLLVLISIIGTYFVLLSTGSIKSEGVNLEVTILDNEKVYDGQPLEAKEYEITGGSLLKGDSIEISYLGSQTDVGFSKSDATVKVVNADEYNVTNDYNIKVNKGNLTVRKRELVVKAKDESIKYSGNDLTGTEYEILSGSLATGNKLYPTFKTVNINEDTNKGISELDALVFDALGNDVTKNYDMTFKDGIVTLDKIAINIRTLSLSKEYDGTSFDESEYSYELVNSTLPNDYKIEVEYENVKVVNVEDSALLTIKNVHIYNAKNEDITNNFAINPLNVGKLSIMPHKINIILDESNNIKEYDGEEFFNKDYSIAGQEDNQSFEYNGKIFNLNLVDWTKITNASSVQNKLTFEIENNNGEDVTTNFEINQTTSILTITKKNLIIYGEDVIVPNSDDLDELKEAIQEKIDESKGTEGFSEDDKEFQNGLLSYHHAYLNYIIPNVVENKNEYALAFTVVVKDRQDIDATDITYNYNITSIYGDLSLKTKYILHFNNVPDAQYNGEKVNIDALNFTCEDTAGNSINVDLIKNNLTFDVKAKETNAFPNVGDYVLEAKLIDTNVDYSIETNQFDYSIVARKTNIVGETYEHEFTGSDIEFKPQSVLDDSITYDKSICTNLAPDEYLEIKYVGSSFNTVKTYEVDYNYKIYNSKGEETTLNYNVENTAKGKFIVTKAVVNVTVLDAVFDYSGVDHKTEVYFNIEAANTTIENDVKAGLTLVKNGTTTAVEIKNAGTYKVSPYCSSSTYEIVATPGTIIVNKVDVLIITSTEVSSNSVVVGDAEINNNLFKNEFKVDTITLNYVGTINNSIEGITAKKSGAKLSNYNLTIVLGTLTKTA